MIGFDYAYGRPSVQGIRNAGGSFVMRYLSTPGNKKNLDADEVQNLKSGGILIGLVFETTANRAMDGEYAGHVDGLAAVQQAQNLGLENQPIYFAVDWDAQPFQFDYVDSYFRGVRTTIGDRVGCYSGYRYMTHVLDIGLVTHGWQTEAWSRGWVDKRIELIQRIGEVMVDGVSCDKDEAFNTNPFGETMQIDEVRAVVREELMKMFAGAHPEGEITQGRNPEDVWVQTLASVFDVEARLKGVEANVNRVVTKLGA